MQMSNSTVQTALFFDVFLYFFDVSEHLALISLNMVICPVYDFGWPVLGGVKGIPLSLVAYPIVSVATKGFSESVLLAASKGILFLSQ